jgi:hypothetical protein
LENKVTKSKLIDNIIINDVNELPKKEKNKVGL